jgi:hypothetical protein
MIDGRPRPLPQAVSHPLRHSRAVRVASPGLLARSSLK